MYTTAQKIKNSQEAVREVNAWRVLQDRIVFTNGCFDLLHLGHVDYLEKAAALGDRLIIGLNSDTSVRALKGEPRPLLDQQSRARLLAAFEFVDAVVIFEEETPAELIARIEPDVLAKGGDYKPEEIAGNETVRARGGKVEIIPLVEGYSTTAIIERIKG